MDRQGAFFTDKQTCRFPGADYPAFNTPDKYNGDGGADLTWPNETSHGTNDQLEAKVTRPNRPLNLVQCEWKTAKSGGSNDRITVGQLDQVIRLGWLLDALAVFIRGCRNKEDGIVVPPHLMDRRERDASWVKSFNVQVHGSITCWKPNGNPETDRRVCSMFSKLAGEALAT
jgi:hypothetical protein